MSQAVISLAGIAGSVVANIALRMLMSKIIGIFSQKLNNMQMQITKDAPSIKIARKLAVYIPGWLWQAVTWMVFIGGYAYGSSQSWTCVVIGIANYFVCEKASPMQKLIFNVGWYGIILCGGWRKCKSHYQDFLALRGGGTPQNWNGFKRITLLEWFGKINTLEPPPTKSDRRGYLHPLEPRPGVRPVVVGIAPQRQLHERSPQEVYDHLRTYLNHFSAENSFYVHTTTSFLENHTAAILAYCDSVTKPIFRTFGCEIAHPHPVDGSLHVMLHPSDIKTVLEAGWGERHSIARADPWWHLWFFAFENRPPIPEDLCFIYAPRSMGEVFVVAKIVQAGVHYVTGLEGDTRDECLGCANHHPRPMCP